MIYNVTGKNFDLQGSVSTEDILKDIIEADQGSQSKNEMVQGVNYYNSVNEILQRDFREFYVDGNKYIDYNKSNEAIVNPLHKKLVDQKAGYIAGKPVVFDAEDEELVVAINEVLGVKWKDTLVDWIVGASNKGRDELQPFIDGDGNFDYTIIPGEQVIYITDTTYEKKVIQAIRYYEMEWVVDGEVKKSLRVELWDEEKVTRYQEIEDGFGDTQYQFIQPGTMGVDVNPQYHWYDYNTNFVDGSQVNSFNDVTMQGIEGQGWGRIPFVCLRNNSNERSDLTPIKRYIDALDVVSSGFVNDLKDIQLAVWVLRGYEGECLSDFMLNLQKFKAIILDNDDSSSAEPKTLEIPKEARETMMTWLENKIYEIGQGVNETKLAGGSITNVVIKSMYAGLDIKANQLIMKLETALSNFMYFVVKYINDNNGTEYDYEDVSFTFNKSMIFNTTEIVEDLVKLKGIISDRTILENCPYVSDVEKELQRLEEQEEAQINALGGGMDFEE